MIPPSIKLIVLDVDGVLTDGTILMAGDSEPAKAFYVRDGCAIKLWQQCGGQVAILSGRREKAVARRAAELSVEYLRTGVSDKTAGYAELLASTGYDDAVVAYLGDDLPDLGPMVRCGFAVAVANAAAPVKQAAAYVTRCRGGAGAVAEVVELLLRRQDRWNAQRLEKAH